VEHGTEATLRAADPHPNRYLAESGPEVDPANGLTTQGYIAVALRTVTLRKLADVVAQAKAAGAFDERDLAWCRELWRMLDVTEPLALALLLREFPDAEVAS
jgi:hypothetical protein